MSPKKILQLILTNTTIALTNIVVFSKAFLGLSLLAGTTLSMSVAWFTIIASIWSFTHFNKMLLTPVDTYALIAQSMSSLDDCVGIFEEAIQNGDVFDEEILKNLDQLKRFKEKEQQLERYYYKNFHHRSLRIKSLRQFLRMLKMLCI